MSRHRSLTTVVLLSALLQLPQLAKAQQTTDPDPAAQQARQALDQALQALANSQWQEAEILLERTLLLQPENAQAMLEMAQLLAHQGRVAGAQAFIQLLLDDVRTPPAHRQRLQQLVQQLGTPAQLPQPDPAPPHWALELAGGHSTNPLAMTDSRAITLTPSSGPVTVPLNTRPHSANYTALGLQWQSDSGYLLALQAQQLDLAQAQTGLRLALQGPLAMNTAKNRLYWQILRQIQLDGATRHQLGVGMTHAPWSMQLDWYKEPTDGRAGLHLRTQYQLQPSPSWQLQGAFEAENNTNGATGAPGMWRLQASAAYRPASPWQLQLHWSHQADTAAYSPLLAYGAPRRLNTLQVNIGYQISPHWALSAYTARRQANIDLFTWAETNVRLAWANRW